MALALDFPRLENRPVYDGYFADPFAFRAEGMWWVVGTGPTNDGRVCPMLVSEDFVNWHSIGGALVPTPELGHDYWAPEITKFGDVYRMFYSVGRGDNGHQLRVAESRRPEGPYVDLGEPVLDHATCPFAIDAHVYCDPEGDDWLFYARDLVDGDRPGTSLVVAPLIDGRRIESDYHVVARANADWQIYERKRPMYDGKVYDWHTLEGPAVVRQGGKLFCLYSGGNWTNETYGVDYVAASRPDGEWSHEPVGKARVLSTGPGLKGPGHNSVVKGPDSAMYIVYHAWSADGKARQMYVSPLRWTEDGPRAEI